MVNYFIINSTDTNLIRYFCISQSYFLNLKNREERERRKNAKRKSENSKEEKRTNMRLRKTEDSSED